jgi:hypothetical protein
MLEYVLGGALCGTQLYSVHGFMIRELVGPRAREGRLPEPE